MQVIHFKLSVILFFQSNTKNMRTFVYHKRFRKTPEIAFVVYTITIYAVKIHQ
jgi:hypothetical protein